MCVRVCVDMFLYVCVCVCVSEREIMCVCLFHSVSILSVDIRAFVLECVSTGTGWLRIVGSLKLQVSFAEYSFFYMALLQKRHEILRSLLIVATPYHRVASYACICDAK